jgi:MFS transporter, DHA1 family, inner membrane transport protein
LNTQDRVLPRRAASSTDISARVQIRTRFALIGVAIAIVSYAVNAMDRTLFPLILPDVAKEYGFTLPQAGLLSTIFTIGMALAGVPTAYLMARWSRKAVAQAGVVIFSVATLVTVLAHGFTDMLLYRALTGIGEAMQLTALLAIVSNYFSRYRGVAIGSLNCSFGVGAVIGPLLGATLLSIYGTWRAPMVAYAVIGFAFIVLIASCLRRSASELTRTASAIAVRGGAQTLRNRNTVVLVLLSCLAGLAIYGFLGMYPTYLRQQLHFTTGDAGKVMSIYGLGVLLSMGGGLLGDRVPMRATLLVSFLVAAIVGWLLFNGPVGFAFQAAFAFAFGVVFSGSLYVNLAAYHVSAVGRELAGHASGVFVTSFYAAASIAGYTVGWLATKLSWTLAGDLQLCITCLVGVSLVFALKPQLLAQHQGTSD